MSVEIGLLHSCRVGSQSVWNCPCVGACDKWAGLGVHTLTALIVTCISTSAASVGCGFAYDNDRSDVAKIVYPARDFDSKFWQPCSIRLPIW